MTTKTLSLITGASSGIGFEIAKQLAARGHDLILVSHDESKLERAASTIAGLQPGALIHALVVDLATVEGPAELLEKTRQLGDVDVFINNAGTSLFGEHVDLDARQLARMLQLNVDSSCMLCLLFGQRMKARGRGHILNIASTSAYQPTPWFAAYGASKAFVLNFSEALAKELEDFGVVVSCLSPGPTDTAFFSEMDRVGIDVAHFDKRLRDTASEVATIGVDMLFRGRLSRIVGAGNFLRALSLRLVSRSVAARIAKHVMRSSVVGSVRPRPQLGR